MRRLRRMEPVTDDVHWCRSAAGERSTARRCTRAAKVLRELRMSGGFKSSRAQIFAQLDG